MTKPTLQPNKTIRTRNGEYEAWLEAVRYSDTGEAGFYIVRMLAPGSVPRLIGMGATPQKAWDDAHKHLRIRGEM